MATKKQNQSITFVGGIAHTSIIPAKSKEPGTPPPVQDTEPEKSAAAPPEPPPADLQTDQPK